MKININKFIDHKLVCPVTSENYNRITNPSDYLFRWKKRN